MIPCVGRDFDGRTSSTSPSMQSSSPGRTGKGQRNSSKPAPTIPPTHRGGMPAARGQPAEDRTACGFVVLVERLRIELGGEGLDPLRVDPDAPGPVRLPGREVLEVFAVHGCVVSSAAGPSFRALALLAR